MWVCGLILLQHALYKVNQHEVGYRKIWKRSIGPILDVDPNLIVPSGISKLRGLIWLLHLLYEDKLSVLYMNGPRNKQIFVGNFSYSLILDVILQNYRRTIWNGGQYGMAYPFLTVRPCHIVPSVNCVSLWINITSAWIEWRKSKDGYRKISKRSIGPILDVDPYLIVPSGISELRGLTWLLHLLYAEKPSVLYMNSPRNKPIFVGIFSYRLILDDTLQNYRRTIWNWATIRYGLPISFCPPMSYCP